MLGGVTYPNNTAVILEHIGLNSLMCTTANNHCCQTSAQGQFYYPNGDPVLSQIQASSSRQSLYQTRNDGSISLKRQAGEIFPPLGRYRCEIPDGRGILQTLYITIGEAIQVVANSVSYHGHALLLSACIPIICRYSSRTRYGKHRMSTCSRLSYSTAPSDLSTRNYPTEYSRLLKVLFDVQIIKLIHSRSHNA